MISWMESIESIELILSGRIREHLRSFDEELKMY